MSTLNTSKTIGNKTNHNVAGNGLNNTLPVDCPKRLSMSEFWREVSKNLSLIVGREYAPSYLREIHNGIRGNKVIVEDVKQAVIETNKTLKKRGQRVIPHLFSNRSPINITD